MSPRRTLQLRLQPKLIIAFILAALIPITLLSSLNFYLTRKALVDDANHILYSSANQAATHIDSFINANLDAVRTEAQIPALARLLGAPAAQQAPQSALYLEVMTILRGLSRRDGFNIVSYAIFNQDGINIVDTTQSNVGADVSQELYFIRAITNQLPYVSPVMFVPGTPDGLLYFSNPIYNARGDIIGVLCLTYRASVLQQKMALTTSQVGDQSFALLLDEHGLRLADSINPDLMYTFIDTLPAEAQQILKQKRRFPDGQALARGPDLPDLSAGIANAGSQPYFQAEVNPQQVGVEQMATARLQTQPWIVAFGQSERVYLAPIQTQIQTTLLFSLVVIMAVVVIAIILARALAGPVVNLTAVAEKVAAGDLSQQVAVRGHDEIATLGTTFNHMTAELRVLYTDMEQQVATRTAALTATMEELERLAADLGQKNKRLSQDLILAHNIQLGLLPDKAPWDPAFVAASGDSLPAAEVGGDFYHFVVFREPHVIGIAIGDISGKGIGAALMMALVFSALESQVHETSQPAALLSALNQHLMGHLKTNHMNAALQFMLIDLLQQTLWVANAGMVAPYLLRAGAVEMIDVSGLPLGAFAQAAYTEVLVKLEPGDTIVLVSDGVVEAHNGAGAMFGFERLEETLRQQSGCAPAAIIDALIEQTALFVGPTEPHDDMTIVAVSPISQQRPALVPRAVAPPAANVIVIDDNADNLLVLQELLQHRVRVNTVSCHTSGQQFFKHREKNPDLPIHVILLDIEIPYENGYAVLQKIRSIPALSQTVVVAVTAHTSAQSVATARRAGFDGFIGKPIKFQRFPGQVQRILAGEVVWEVT